MEIEIDSAGILGIHQGELPDPRMRKHASKEAIHWIQDPSVKIADFYSFDLIIGMDDPETSRI